MTFKCNLLLILDMYRCLITTTTKINLVKGPATMYFIHQIINSRHGRLIFYRESIECYVNNRKMKIDIFFLCQRDGGKIPTLTMRDDPSFQEFIREPSNVKLLKVAISVEPNNREAFGGVKLDNTLHNSIRWDSGVPWAFIERLPYNSREN